MAESSTSLDSSFSAKPRDARISASRKELAWMLKKEESFGEKFSRKFKENPFVPLGCLLTATVLSFGLGAFKTGKTRQSQLLMRARVLAQGLTVAAFIGGLVIAAKKESTE